MKKHVENAIPTEEMTIAGRTYDLFGFRQGSKKTAITQANEMSANLGEEDGWHILDHQADIPTAFRGKVIMFFTEWRDPVGNGLIACVYWRGDKWIVGWRWRWLDDDHLRGRGRVLRRRKEQET